MPGILLIVVLAVAASPSARQGEAQAVNQQSSLNGPTLTVDVSAGRHRISPDIYGMNFADEALARELRLPVRRWGGNATTRYNWQNDTSNRASDWYFENIPEDNPNPAALPDGSSADKFVEQNRRAGTKTLLTIPTIGWTPKSRCGTLPTLTRAGSTSRCVSSRACAPG